jgi:hypothetical protein
MDDMTPENSPHLDLEITYDNIKKWCPFGLNTADLSNLLMLALAGDISDDPVLVRKLPERHLRDFFCRVVNGWTMNSYGTKFHHLDGKLCDGPNGEPAVVFPDGRTERYRRGKKIEEGYGK